MRRLNEMFHIENEQLIKTSNGQPVPEDEPIFILRARDLVSIFALQTYRSRCRVIGTPADRLEQLDSVIDQFQSYKQTHATKVPGSTHGL